MKEIKIDFLHGGKVWDKDHPDEWIDFSANINPLGMPENMQKKIYEAQGYISYYPQEYSEKATQNVADYLDMPVENILLTNGGIDALRIAADYVCPRHCVIPVPCFVEYLRFSDVVSAKTIYSFYKQVDNEFSLDADDVIRKIGRDSTVFLNNPVNPTGMVLDEKTLIKILYKAKIKNAIVILDEAFIDFCPEYSLRQLIHEFDNLIITLSFTKFFAIPGIRLGGIIASSKVIDSMKSAVAPWSVNIFAQFAAMGIEKDSDFARETIKTIAKNRKILMDELKTMGLKVFNSYANYVLVDIREKGLTVDKLNKRLENKKIMVRDCSNYIGLDEYYMRVAVKSEEDNERLLKVLKDIFI